MSLLTQTQPRGRFGLVLGGGGLLGGAWMGGALLALSDVLDFDPRAADMIIGTSAGAIVASMLGSGVGPTDIVTHQRDQVIDTGPLSGFVWSYGLAVGGSWPPLPLPIPGCTKLLIKNRGQLREIPNMVKVASLLPRGRRELVRIGQLLHHLAGDAWVDHRGLRVVTTDFESGARVIFGSPQAPSAALKESVLASCAVPAWFRPVTISGRTYIDGGAHSATNVDVALESPVDHVFVVAPMVSLDPRPRRVRTWAIQEWRARVTAQCLQETRILQRRGIGVTIIGPSAKDIQLMGLNMMAAERRFAVLETAIDSTRRALRDAEASCQYFPPDQVSVTDEALAKVALGAHHSSGTVSHSAAGLAHL